MKNEPHSIIKISKALGTKCVRCYKVLEEVTHHPHHLCNRCECVILEFFPELPMLLYDAGYRKGQKDEGLVRDTSITDEYIENYIRKNRPKAWGSGKCEPLDWSEITLRSLQEDKKDES